PWAAGRARPRPLERLAGIASGTIDQAGRQPFRVVEQDLEQMVGGELLMALAQGQRLGGFHKTAGAVGVLLEIHVSTPSAHDGAGQIAGPRRRPALGLILVVCIAVGRPNRLDLDGLQSPIVNNAARLMTDPSATVQAIYRYPVKGLSPQRLERVALSAGATLPADRLYAIENGPSGFDPAAPAYFPKQRFLMLMRNERLAALRTGYDEASHTLSIEWEGRVAARGDLRTSEGRLSIEAFFRRFMPKELRGPPKVLFGDGHSFSDV